MPGLRGRVISSAKAQLFNNLARATVQIGTVAALIPLWGLDRYGEWLILSAFPTYLALSDLGYFAAARNDMIMAVARGDRQQAVDVFRAVSRGVGIALLLLACVLPLAALAMPLTDWLNLQTMSESTAAVVVVLLGLMMLLASYGGLLQAGFACVGRFGEGTTWLSTMMLVDFVALVAAVALTKNPAVAAGAMLTTRSTGVALHYLAMNRRAPWLSFGRPRGRPQVLRRLTTPALASAALPSGVALNIQGMVVIVGLLVGPASAAIFATVRTMSRVVLQVLRSISMVTGPEFSRAYGEADHDLLRQIHRRGCRLALWATIPIAVTLALFGGEILSVWTSGRIESGGLLLLLFLAATSIDSLWYTSAAVLYSTNQHQRVAVIFFSASVLVLPVAWGLLEIADLEGAAAALLLLETVMLVVVLRESIPAAYDRFMPWLRSTARPPGPSAVRALVEPLFNRGVQPRT